jgi:acetyltransferase-like isoleucine patch superfamily enzyme
LGLKQSWTHFWVRRSGTTQFGRIAASLALWYAPPLYERVPLADLTPRGFISGRATIYHPGLSCGENVLLDDGVVIYRDKGGGPVKLGNGVHVWRDTMIQTGDGGAVVIGDHTHIQPKCQFSAYHSSIEIGIGVEIAPFCSFYPYDHGIEPATPIGAQPLESKGPIVVGDGAWLGVGVIVLSGVRIGRGAVIGAGSVVTRDIPDRSVAAGAPARVVHARGERRGSR